MSGQPPSVQNIQVGADIGAFSKLLNEYVKFGEFEDMHKRVKKMEKRSNKWKPLWKQMSRDIEDLQKSLTGKVDCTTFDEELQRLKDLINQLASSGKEISAPIVQSGPSLSSKDLNDFKEAIKKVHEHDEKLKGLNFDSLLKKVSTLADEVAKKAEITDIMRLENDKSEKFFVENKFKELERELSSLKDWCGRLDQLLQSSSKPTNSITDQQFVALTQRVDRLEEKLMHSR